jgi:hypothetical protein
MSFCTGCTHFSNQHNKASRMPDGTYAHGSAYFCNCPEAIKASQKEPDPNYTSMMIGKVCWTCRGHYYAWDGVTPKPSWILALEESKKQVSKLKTPVSEKTSGRSRKDKRAPGTNKSLLAEW